MSLAVVASNDTLFQREISSSSSSSLPSPKGTSSSSSSLTLAELVKSPRAIKMEAGEVVGRGGGEVEETGPLTPPRSPTSLSAKSPKKSPFANSIYEHIPPVVKKLYRVIQKHTGSVGGYGHAGAIYGELTMGAFQKIVNFLKQHNRFDSQSLFLDIGAGLGKPNFHVSGDPAVKVSFGVELEQLRWELSLHNLVHVLAEVPELKSLSEQPSIFFARDDITNTETFEPFTHLYSFDVGFPPAVMRHMATAFNRSNTPLVFVSFHKPRKMVGEYGFSVDLCGTVSASMCGSNEGHTAYVYRHVANYRRLYPNDLLSRPSLPFNLTPKTTQTRLEDYLKHVKTAPNEQLDEFKENKMDTKDNKKLIEEVVVSPSSKGNTKFSTSTPPATSKRKVTQDQSESKRQRIQTPPKSPLAVRLFEQVTTNNEEVQTLVVGEQQQEDVARKTPTHTAKTPSRASSRKSVARRKTVSALKNKLPNIDEQQTTITTQQEDSEDVDFDARKQLFPVESDQPLLARSGLPNVVQPVATIDRVFAQGFDLMAAMKADEKIPANIDRDGGANQDVSMDVVEKYRAWVKAKVQALQSGSRTPRKASQSPSRTSPSRSAKSPARSPGRSPGRKGGKL